MTESSLAPSDPDALPNPERVDRRTHLLGAGLTALVAVAWVGLAARTPTATFHFAPLIAAAAWPAALRGGGPLRVAPVDAFRAAAGAAAVGFAALGVLLAFDWLRGPTFWDAGPAVVEVVPMIVVGAAAGYRYARCGTPGVPAP